jgi:hypothetical protein
VLRTEIFRGALVRENHCPNFTSPSDLVSVKPIIREALSSLSHAGIRPPFSQQGHVRGTSFHAH